MTPEFVGSTMDHLSGATIPAGRLNIVLEDKQGESVRIFFGGMNKSFGWPEANVRTMEMHAGSQGWIILKSVNFGEVARMSGIMVGRFPLLVTRLPVSIKLGDVDQLVTVHRFTVSGRSPEPIVGWEEIPHRPAVPMEWHATDDGARE